MGDSGRIAIAAVGAVFLLVLVPAYLHAKKGASKKAYALCFKGACTLVPVLLCLAGAGIAAGRLTGAWWMTVGLVLCLVGDILLELVFLAGMAAFLCGHLAYIAGFLAMAPFRWESVPIFAIALLIVVVLFYRLLPQMKEKRGPFIGYAVVLLAMLAVAMALPFSLGARGAVAAAGALLFVVSDLLLARNLLLGPIGHSDAVSLGCYFSGQYLLALSVWCFAVGMPNA